MIDRRKLILGSLLIGLGFSAAPALAQQADDGVRIRGTIDKLDGEMLTIKAADGSATDIHIAADTVITHNQPSSLSDIKPGDFVASAAMKGDDGKLHSTEVRIFPPELKGLGEGQRPMQDKNKTMTNATVSDIVVLGTEGQDIKVKFHGQDSELVVGPDVPVTRVAVGSVSDLKPGATVFVMAKKADDGTLNATRVLAQ